MKSFTNKMKQGFIYCDVCSWYVIGKHPNTKNNIRPHQAPHTGWPML